MKVLTTSLEGVLILEPDAYGDERGYFMETFHEKRYKESGIAEHFVQDNLSFSRQGTLRGLHYQEPNQQAKLVQVMLGRILDVAVDIRRGSTSFGRWTSVQLTDKNRRQLFLPRGFAHGFLVLSETAYVHYKCSDFYSPESEGGVLWSDPDLAINWQVEKPLLSEKDRSYPRLKDIPIDQLPSISHE